jgi:D-glycero-alpha-D-manno-heptose-7-phosphate kinase
LSEPGGWQDQCFSAYGGMRLFKFENHDFSVHQNFVDDSFISELNERMILVSTGNPRDSAAHAAVTKKRLSDKSGFEYAEDLAQLALETRNRITSAKNSHQAITNLAEGINIGWNYKTQLNGNASEEVQNLISQGKKSGALAAKLCGAGGTGFVFFLLGDTSRKKFAESFPNSRVQNIEIFRKSDSGTDVGLRI